MSTSNWPWHAYAGDIEKERRGNEVEKTGSDGPTSSMAYFLQKKALFKPYWRVSLVMHKRRISRWDLEPRPLILSFFVQPEHHPVGRALHRPMQRGLHSRYPFFVRLLWWSNLHLIAAVRQLRWDKVTHGQEGTTYPLASPSQVEIPQLCQTPWRRKRVWYQDQSNSMVDGLQAIMFSLLLITRVQPIREHCSPKTAAFLASFCSHFQQMSVKWAFYLFFSCIPKPSWILLRHFRRKRSWFLTLSPMDSLGILRLASWISLKLFIPRVWCPWRLRMACPNAASSRLEGIQYTTSHVISYSIPE